jgi:glutamate-1-semialdehyde aminotransferase
MEKTIDYAINEALETGRLSAMPQFLEMELREKIAQEIESHMPHGQMDDITLALNQAARIARGQHYVND